MAMKRTIRRGLASPAICWGLGIWTAVGCVLSAPALVQQPGSGVEGRWAGSVVLPTGELPFSVTFERADGALSATMDIPAQGVLDLLLTAVSYADGRVHFELQAPIGLAVWDGAHEGDTIEGEFTQGAAPGTFSVERAAVVEPDTPAEYQAVRVLTSVLLSPQAPTAMRA